MPSAPIEFLVFDLDGTLIDSRKDICIAVNHALTTLGIEPVADDEIVRFVGRGVANLIRSALEAKAPASDEKIFKKAIKLFKEHYASHLLDHTKLYPGVVDVLHLPQKKAVLTNKPKEFSERILEGLKVLSYFEEVVGGDAGKKPDPAGLLGLIGRLKADPQSSMLIGDSTIDIQTGKNAGARTCAVTYGFEKKENLLPLSPDYILNHIGELKEVLKRERSG